MNAKKIMGAVLVALLAAALFVGAGAAADTLDLGSVPAYTNLNGGKVDFSGSSFVSDDGKTVIYPTTYKSALYFAVNDEAYGKVYTGTALEAGTTNVVSVKFTLVAPTATISALKDGISIIGQTVTADMAEDTVYTVEGFNNAYVVFIDEDGVIYDGKKSGQNADGFKFTPGKWGVAANLTGQTGVPGVQIIGLPYYFTVSESDAILTSVKDTVNIGQSIVLNVLVPGEKSAKVYFDGKVKLTEKAQAGVTYNKGDKFVTVALGIDGRGSVAFVADDAGETTFKLEDKYDVEVTVTIAEGVITAVADEEFFFVGNPLYLSGTTTAGKGLHFYIEGQNFLFTNIDGAITSGDLEFDGENWNVKINATNIKDANGKTLIAGTYPVIVSLAGETTKDAKDVQSAGIIKKKVMESTYATASVTLTQPFITDVSAPGVVVQGDEYKITGTAYAAKNVRLYVFGTNYFAVQGDETDKNEQFEFDILSSSVTQEMAVGTYFYLIQHPMKDTYFNVWNSSAEEDMYADFYYAATLAGANNGLNAADETAGEATFIFNAYTRGTNYAAQALLEAISGQDIDDIFVQGTFEVEAKKLEINPIPAEVAKGTALTVSGYTNSGEGVEVIVNVLAGKFGATVKGDENAALFLTAKAVTKEDGTFEAKIDTSKLELGSYIVTVEIDGTQYDTAAVSIVAASEPVTPPADDEPVTPPADDEPGVPETPGFGALAALAGLGAVAVLLLRRE